MTATRWFSSWARTTVVAPASGSALVRVPRPRHEVRAELLELERSSVFERLLGVGDRLERLVVDHDELGGIDGGRLGLGDDDGDRLPDEADLVRRRAADGHKPG